MTASISRGLMKMVGPNGFEPPAAKGVPGYRQQRLGGSFFKTEKASGIVIQDVTLLFEGKYGIVLNRVDRR